MNCCWLLILLFLCGGNGFGSCGCGCNTNRCVEPREKDCGCGNDRPSRFDSCGCDDNNIQPRAFSGFPNVGTCGCEEKKDNDNDC